MAELARQLDQLHLTPAQPTFMGIPREIRLTIYKNIFLDWRGVVDIEDFLDDDFPWPILQVSRTVRTEALHVLFTECEFHDDDVDSMVCLSVSAGQQTLGLFLERIRKLGFGIDASKSSWDEETYSAITALAAFKNLKELSLDSWDNPWVPEDGSLERLFAFLDRSIALTGPNIRINLSLLNFKNATSEDLQEAMERIKGCTILKNLRFRIGWKDMLFNLSGDRKHYLDGKVDLQKLELLASLIRLAREHQSLKILNIDLFDRGDDGELLEDDLWLIIRNKWCELLEEVRKEARTGVIVGGAMFKGYYWIGEADLTRNIWVHKGS